MRRLILAAGVAAIAISVPAVSQPGDRGGGKERKAQVQKSERGGDARAQRADKQRPQRAESAKGQAKGQERRAQAQERRGPRGERAENRRMQEQSGPGERRVERRGERKVEKMQDQREKSLERREGRGERVAERNEDRIERMRERREVYVDRIDGRENRRVARLAESRVVPLREWNELARGGVWLEGCPPGLAKKLVPCVPPGQVRNMVGQPLSALRERVRLSELPNRLRYAYADDEDYYYRYGNGHVYRVDRSSDIVRALLPLFGLGLTVGQQFPSSYSNHYLPTGLQPFYANNSYTDYRYANGYVYQVDPRTGLIQGVDPMLGYGFGYGQMMPATYSAYNLPYQYRPLYSDTADQYYRYAPGAIYQVDAQTSLITAVAALLTGGMTVGQPMPEGYGAYNVPYDYRTTYYDTPDAWHRYSNGQIYRIDPKTQLVTAVVQSILG
ncbi:MAG TPA: hypothetical protein VMK31_01050 [Sphingomicrobium sp.]|nr:hypothetical protein [Sphingomicrobium sp.]